MTLLPVPGPCALGRHTVHTERLLLYTPETQLDLLAAIAAGSDAEAQRWLGMRGEEVVADARLRETLLRMRPGDNDRKIRRELLVAFEPGTEAAELLVGVRRDNGRYAAALQLDHTTGQTGGWLAPHGRGQGLGAELFAAGALLGHSHFGMDTVHAGTEATNAACRGALLRAGFVPAEGPPTHTLRDGREIDSTWFRHGSGPVARCRAAGVAQSRV
ncbi:N-acetyltransferase [Streptomyces spinoverrucosus]|uniref:N-acetyltransferase n=1 Tax=Streptomyces spinoverrucosus TaxID=284043 RepID=A0A4Y3VTE1_9ACTN|nr:GNAT family protein [Streptomyces spinoverrucosus]GEC09001.1 N-acetyltransferase [Streptomyces spinoverrucosus]GHB66164.1 N-acetyltransferase [Streptomyces spinoverrucosus]